MVIESPSTLCGFLVDMAVEPVVPHVSVVVPVYSGSETIPALIERCEALRQGCFDLPAGILTELIFVCDEPVDASEALLHRERETHDWITVVSLARNGGQHLATAVGILYSKGDWILTIDEDLAHPPELLGKALEEVLGAGLDTLYVRSTEKIHTKSLYLDATSKASKLLLRFLTRDDYAEISSFRLIRGEVGRAVAKCVDSKLYFDAVLFAATSKVRRSVFYSNFRDSRRDGGSGYNLAKLIRHYGRFVMSAEFSGLQLLNSIGVLVAAPLLLFFAGLLVLGLVQGVQQFTPGWLSLFSLGLTAIIFIVAFGIYSLKLISVLFLRSTGLPPFLVINRQLDRAHLAFLTSRQPG